MTDSKTDLLIRALHAARGMVLLIGLAAFTLSSPVWAHGGEDHGDEKPAAALNSAPRLTTQSELFELVAVPSAKGGGTLNIYLHDAATNASITGANIEMTAGADTVQATTQGALYQVKAPWVLNPGHFDLTFSISAGDTSDLLIGRLDVPEPAPSEPPHNTLWDHVWPHDLAVPDIPQKALAAAFGLAVIFGLIGLRLAPGLRRIMLTVAAIIGISSATAAAVAMIKDASKSGASSEGLAALLDVPDVSRRLADGAIFLPKATQRLLDVATLSTTPAETTQKTVRLIGQIVPDPNRSGLVQALLAGRIEAPDAGFPAIGARVKKGDVLGYLAPRIEIVDQSDISQTQGDLDRQIALAEAKFNRIEPLKGRAVPEGQVTDAKIELDLLRKRRAAIKPVLGERSALIAPVDGTLAQANVSAGQVVEAQTLLFQIVDPDNLWVEALAFDTATAASIEKSAKPASASTADGRKMALTFAGRGLALRQQAVPMRFRIAPGDAPLNVGEAVTVQAPIDETLSATVLPRASVVRAPNGQAIVWAKADAERFEPRIVQTVAIDAERLGVTAGLQAGTRVVVRGAELVNQVR